MTVLLYSRPRDSHEHSRVREVLYNDSRDACGGHLLDFQSDHFSHVGLIRQPKDKRRYEGQANDDESFTRKVTRWDRMNG